jgi:hypothetical protein
MTEKDLSRYKNGKIYAIRSSQTDKYYIGSTCLDLCKRLYSHKRDLRYFMNGNEKHRISSSHHIIKHDDCYIELIENYPCNSKAELEKREGEIQREKKEEIVNVRVSGRSSLQHYHENKDKRKIYYNDNIDKINDIKKKYTELHYDELKEYRKAYYEANR